jgi:hypothetical protein
MVLTMVVLAVVVVVMGYGLGYRFRVQGHCFHAHGALSPLALPPRVEVGSTY